MHARTLLRLTVALAAVANVCSWGFSKDAESPGQNEPLPAVQLPPTAEHYWWNTITQKTQWEDPNPHLATGITVPTCPLPCATFCRMNEMSGSTLLNRADTPKLHAIYRGWSPLLCPS